MSDPVKIAEEIYLELKNKGLQIGDVSIVFIEAIIRKYFTELEQQNKELLECLILIKHKLETDEAITDTIWIDDDERCTETAVDRIDYLIEKTS